MKAPCTLCGKPVETRAVGTYRQTSGYTQRQEGGRGGIRLATYGDGYAHKACVDLEASGIGSKQESLL